MTGRLLATCIPQRQGCRISNLDPAKAVFLPAFLPDGREPRWSVLGRSSTFFRTDTKRELGGYQLRDGAQGDPVIGLLHPATMEHPNAESVAPDYANPRR